MAKMKDAGVERQQREAQGPPERIWVSTDRQWAKNQTPICTQEYVRQLPGPEENLDLLISELMSNAGLTHREAIVIAARALTPTGRPSAEPTAEPFPAGPTFRDVLSALEWCARYIWQGATEIDGGDFQAEMLRRGLMVEVPASEQIKEEWDTETMLTFTWMDMPTDGGVSAKVERVARSTGEHLSTDFAERLEPWWECLCGTATDWGHRWDLTGPTPYPYIGMWCDTCNQQVAPGNPTPRICTRCDKPIEGAFVGDGDGSGQRFAHRDCFYGKPDVPPANEGDDR